MSKNKIFEELKENPEYKKILEGMSNEERQMAEKAASELLEAFERDVLEPLRNLPKK